MEVFSVQVMNVSPQAALRQKLKKLGDIEVKYVVQSHEVVEEYSLNQKGAPSSVQKHPQIITTVTVFFERK